MPLALGMEKQLFAVLSAQERRDFKAVLTRINDQVHKLESMTPGKKDD